jgi:hypothetical protein
VRLSATTMLKKGRAFAPPRESRMTTMIYPQGVGPGESAWLGRHELGFDLVQR